MATGKNSAHDALRQTVAPEVTAIDDFINKNDLEYYFDNLAAAVTTEKVVLEKLTATIAALTINNEKLVVTNSKLATEVTNLTRRLGQNTNRGTSGTTVEKQSSKTCLHCKKRAFTSLTPDSNWPRMQAALPIGKVSCDMVGPLT